MLGRKAITLEDEKGLATCASALPIGDAVYVDGGLHIMG